MSDSPIMRSLKVVFVAEILCLLGVCISLVNSEEDYTRRPAGHESLDTIHQVGYNYPSWPLPEPPYGEGPTQQPSLQKDKEVTTLDRFYRISPDGTVEFKFALSDGQVNHQKIYSKFVNGTAVQVYDGYYSVRSPDGCYRTTYYRADERGYRLLKFTVSKEPPVEWRGHDVDKLV